MRRSGKRLFTLACNRPRIFADKNGAWLFAGPSFLDFSGLWWRGRFCCVFGKTCVYVMVFCGEVVVI
jgi:hypothetical protein